MDRRMDGWMGGWIMDGWMNGGMDGWMNGRMDKWIYVSIYLPPSDGLSEVGRPVPPAVS